MSSLHRELLIGGHLFGGVCDSSLGKTQHYAPYDGALVGTSAEASWNEVNLSLDSAREAFETWKYSNLDERKKLLDSIANKIEEHTEELSELLTHEVGKPIIYSRAEVKRCELTFRLASDFLSRLKPEDINLNYDPRGSQYKCTVLRQPIGVVLGIVPYNWPLNLAAHKLAPAIATGNTVIIKAPTTGALSTLTLGHLIHEAGCPDGVVNFISCSNELAQKAVTDSRIDITSFTGSPKVGWMLKELIPQKRVTLELGGDATMTVHQDADIDQVIKSLIPSAFAYAGQVCIATQHTVVHESLFPEFKAKLIKAVESCQWGDPSQVKTVCGPVISEQALDNAKEFLEDAESQGATLLTGGNIVGQILEPTLLENVTREMKLGREEAFAPILTIQPYKEISEAISWINSSQYGLHCSIFTHDESIIQSFQNELALGGLVINDSPSVRFDVMPYGGEKQSGFGREGVWNSMQEMTRELSIVKKK